jgi:hypothetical protein
VKRLVRIAFLAALCSGVSWAQAIPFFNGTASLGNSWFWLQLLPSAGCPSGNSHYFGYYSFTAAPWIDHLDMGWEAYSDAGDTLCGAWLFDNATGHYFYTAPSWFPTLYDSNLNQTMIYQNQAGYVDRYTSNPRVFYIPATGKYTELGSALAVPTGLSINNGGSTGDAQPGVTVPFTFTYNDQWNGAGDITFGQVWFLDNNQNVQCHLQWGSDGSLDLWTRIYNMRRHHRRAGDR